MGTGTSIPWFLDVDGVLVGDRQWSWPHYSTVVITSDYMGHRVLFAPDLIECLNLMAAQQLIRVRWLTTWEYEAVEKVAPALGLRVGGWVAGIDDDPHGQTWWKLHTIQEYLDDEGHWFIWTDDDIHRYLEARRFVDFLPPGIGLAIEPDSRDGLTPEHIEQILDRLEQVQR